MSTRLTEARAALDTARRDRRTAPQRGPTMFTPAESEAEPSWTEPASLSGAVTEHIDAAIRAAAEELEYLSVVDVTPKITEPLYDLRVIGNRMLAAARRGWIESTGEYESGGAERHGRPIRRWRSLLASHPYATNAEPELGAVIDHAKEARDVCRPSYP